MTDQHVTLLLTQWGQVSSVWASREEAAAKAKQLNDDPFVAPGEPDQDAPYSVEEMVVR